MPRAKGRLLPSSLSKNQAYSLLPLRAKALYPLIIANADDQGRLIAEPQMLKWEVCPNVEEISRDDIGEVLVSMESVGLIRVYDAGGVRALQLQSWWIDQASMQWAYPSDFSPAEGWDDRLRFRRGNQVITINWPGKENGSQTKSLQELQLDLSGSLEIAARKALGNAQVSAPGNGRPNALPNAQVNNPGNPSLDSLPEADKGKGKGKGNEKSNDSVSAETGSSEHPSDPAHPTVLSPPHSYREWVALLDEATNGRQVIGTLADFARTCYPEDAQGGTAGPSMQQLASNIGGILQTHNLDALDLFKIMWRAAANLPEGDFLAYVRSAVKRQEEGDGRGERSDGDGGGEEWPGFDVEDDGPVGPEDEDDP